MIPYDHINWDEFAQFDSCYSRWLQRVDELCQTLLSCSLYDVVMNGDLDPSDAYREQRMRPEQYFAWIVVPTVENEYGHECVHEAIAEAVLRGKPLEHDS